MKIFLSVFLSLLFSGVSCNTADQDAALQRMVDQADDIQVFQIDQFPTPLDEQSNTQTYIADYLVVKTILLDKDEEKSLRESLKNKDQFIRENQKTCPFIAQYAIRMARKTSWVEMVLSRDNCPKGVLRSSYNEKVEHFDLMKDGVLQFFQKQAF